VSPRPLSLKTRAQRIVQRLRETYPNVTTALRWETPWELLVATILSAQCTDERVNQVTKTLFQRYPSVKDFAAADLAALEQEIRPTGFFRNKAKSIVAAAQMILDRFDGEVPGDIDLLTTLPGVARKTANVVLSHAIRPDDPQGIVVDRHVARVAGRLQLYPEDCTTPEAIEEALMRLIPKDSWVHFGDALVWHGRLVCTARKPNCAACTLADLCPSCSTDD
jgi:endonuclease-3